MNGTAADATVEAALANDLREIAGIAARIDGFCAGHGIAREVAYAVNLALEELLSNTIAYGYNDEEPHRIEVLLRLEGQALVVIVVDDARAFDPTRTPEPDPASLLDDEDGLGGLGLLLVNRMMDRVEYQRRAGCNVTVLTKDTASDTGEDGEVDEAVSRSPDPGSS
ncbi:MAG: ATP-binding protein [Alphaproteobacteria bacterium]|nr:ATP-binding protein [Alphaproteobacteria bacterium]